MPKTKEQKKEILEQIKDKLSKSKSVVFSSDTGLNVKTAQQLRNELRANGAEYFVAKKTLLQKATQSIGEEKVIDELSGSVGLTLSYDDEVAGVRVIDKFAKANEGLKLGGGILEGKFIMPDLVKTLASLPSKDQLLAKLVGTINAPVVGLVRVLSGTTRNFVGVLNAIKEKK